MGIFAESFVFNGKSSNDYGLIICSINSGGTKSISAGSAIDLQTVKIKDKWRSTSVGYKDVISASFMICKKDYTPITYLEQAEINRWLIRKDGYKSLQFTKSNIEMVLYDVIFSNVNMFSVGNLDYAMELSFSTNQPYGHSKKKEKVFNMTGSTMTNMFMDMSDETGETFPDMKIEILEDSNFQIYNELTNTTFRINNCKSGEIITVNSNTGDITTTLSTHNVMSDFNLSWFRFANTYETRKNLLTFTGRAKVTIYYREIRKVGVG